MEIISIWYPNPINTSKDILTSCWKLQANVGHRFATLGTDSETRNQIVVSITAQVIRRRLKCESVKLFIYAFSHKDGTVGWVAVS